MKKDEFAVIEGDAEEATEKRNAKEFFDSGELWRLPAGTVSSLRAIHKSLFSGVFDFAGEIRRVNVAKGGMRFAPVLYLQETLSEIEKMPMGTFDEAVEKYVEMNVAHPFREGNGRSGRIWLDMMLRCGIGRVVNWSVIEKGEYLSAMERSPVDDRPLKELLFAALTDETDEREVFLRSIDAGFSFEGLSSIRAEET